MGMTDLEKRTAANGLALMAGGSSKSFAALFDVLTKRATTPEHRERLRKLREKL